MNQDKGPLVSVIMPAYHSEQYIGPAIESILNQTYGNLELIIIEDGSADRTEAVIRSFKDTRIRSFNNKENRGIAYSTNLGLRESRGSYIALMDDDDIALEKRLEYQVQYMDKHKDIDILGGRSIKIDGQGREMGFGNTPRNNPNYIKAVLLFQCMDFINGTAMIRREFIVKNGLEYQENCYGMQDFKFYIDSSKLGKISTMDQFLLKYRVHDGNETKRRKESFKAERAGTYARFQRESLRRSGFKLDEPSLSLIHKVFAEDTGHCGSIEELKEFYRVSNTILQQAREMNIDYFDELRHVLATKLSKQLMNWEFWESLIP